MGDLAVLFTDKLVGSKTWDIGQLCNGILSGLVSITAGNAAVSPYAAIIIGPLGGLVDQRAPVVILPLIHL